MSEKKGDKPSKRERLLAAAASGLQSVTASLRNEGERSDKQEGGDVGNPAAAVERPIVDGSEREAVLGRDQPAAVPAPVTAGPSVVSRHPIAVQRENLMADLVTEREKAEARAREAEERLSVALTAGSEHKIDPLRVRVSEYANRVQNALTVADPKFQELVDSIEAKKRNTIPIIVRRIEGDPQFDFELAAGHRRLAAVRYLCFERQAAAGEAPVEVELYASIQDLDDAALVTTMWLENHGRVDISPFERASTLVSMQKTSRASLRELETISGVSRSVLQRLLALAAWPVELLDAFGPDRRVIPLQAVERIGVALNENRDAVIARARGLATEQRMGGRVLAPGQVVERLLGVPAKSVQEVDSVRVTSDRSGTVIRLPSVAPHLHSGLAKVVQEFLRDLEKGT